MKISVIIATRNRKEDLIVTIDGYLAQLHPDKEIIVIDNNSNDGTPQMMKDLYPDIKYLWLPDNFDIRSMNLAIEMSSGDLIWRTDSDSHPESPNAFTEAIEIFRNNPEVHVIATEDIEVRQGNRVWQWYPFNVDKVNIPQGGYPANLFAGTGAVIRREVYDKIGGFWEFGFEEIDFCTRAILAGFNVRYYPNIRTLHFASPRDRDNPNRWIQISKQFVRYTWKFFPFWRALGRTITIFFFQFLFAVMSRFSPLVILEGYLTMTAVSISTFRNERNVVPATKLHDITLGVPFVKPQFKFLIQRIKGFFGARKLKGSE